MVGDKHGRRDEIRDQSLLDVLETIPQAEYEANVWRSVRTGLDTLLRMRLGGRWDDPTFDVLYTSETREGALAERRFHFFQGQPIPPSKVQYELFELSVSLKAVMDCSSFEVLTQIGLDIRGYGRLNYLEREQEYPKSQEIAEACSFLGADGIRVPCARHVNEKNLIIFCEATTEIEKILVAPHGVVDYY